MPASLALILDTTAPTLTVDAPVRVEPPDHLVVTVVSNEPVGLASAALIDALGSLTNLGVERSDEHTLLLSVPTLGLATGPATLRLSVADQVLNIAERILTVIIDRPRAFDVVLTLDPGHEVDLTLDGGHEVVLDIVHAHQTHLEVS